MNRRMLLKSISLGLALAGINVTVSQAMAKVAPESNNTLKFGPSHAMNWEILKNRIEQMAQQIYSPPLKPAPWVTQAIDYETHGKIKFKPGLALGANSADTGQYPVTFFHLGRYSQKPVKIYVVEDGRAREILYSPVYFDIPADSPAHKLPENSGFAGFRLHEAKTRADWPTQDWVAFLGASYFRAIGALNQYGLSARAVAIDTALPTPEEFPDFTEIYLAPQDADVKSVVIYALLEGASIVGAYQFTIHRDTGVTMEIRSDIILRKDVERLALAPLTSMYWYSETHKTQSTDWRPEVHDSDGLALWRGNGERIWRPLNNPPHLMVSAFMDENPNGFGLLQRDRNFDNYLDGVNYDRRPSLWVTPVGNWGRGTVQLIELPTDDEIHDNIVAAWVPEGTAKAGNRYALSYKLHWQANEPYFPETLGYTRSTYIGHGGEPGKSRPQGLRKIVVEYEGQSIANILPTDAPVSDVSLSRGILVRQFAEWVAGTHRWRITVDVAMPIKNEDDNSPIEVRMFLKLDDKPLTETTLVQLHHKVDP